MISFEENKKIFNDRLERLGKIPYITSHFIKMRDNLDEKLQNAWDSCDEIFCCEVRLPGFYHPELKNKAIKIFPLGIKVEQIMLHIKKIYIKNIITYYQSYGYNLEIVPASNIYGDDEFSIELRFDLRYDDLKKKEE